MNIVAVFVALLGLAIGSFINVCICRLPKRTSVVTPASRCPSCGHKLRVWENLPVLSYLMLRGKCSRCRQPIGWMYPVVEILTAVVLLSLYFKFGLTWLLLTNGLFCGMLVTLIFIDLRERILPDRITLSGFMIGLVFAPFQAEEFLPGTTWMHDVGLSLLGALVGGGLLWMVAFLYFKLRKIEGLGFGDVKMMAMVGAFLGWRFALFTIFVGSVLGAVVGTAYILVLGKGRRYELPFGSFLGLAAILATLWGKAIVDWYLPVA